jgi:hypothetical protein
MAPRPRPLPRALAAPTLAERLGERLPIWMLWLTPLPIVATLLSSLNTFNFLQALLVTACIPSVVLIPILGLWQAGFLLHLYVSESELLTQRLVVTHLLTLAFGAWVWMYAMPSY